MPGRQRLSLPPQDPASGAWQRVCREGLVIDLGNDDLIRRRSSRTIPPHREKLRTMRVSTPGAGAPSQPIPGRTEGLGGNRGGNLPYGVTIPWLTKS